MKITKNDSKQSFLLIYRRRMTIIRTILQFLKNFKALLRIIFERVLHAFLQFFVKIFLSNLYCVLYVCAVYSRTSTP